VDNNVWEFEKIGNKSPSKSMSQGSSKSGKQKAAMSRTNSLEMPAMTYGSPLQSPISLSTSGFSSMANSYVVSPDTTGFSSQQFDPIVEGYNYNFGLAPDPSLQTLQPTIYPSPETSQSNVDDAYKTMYNDESYFQLSNSDSLYDGADGHNPSFESSFGFEGVGGFDNYSVTY
jgi:hypothetical protein